MSREGLHQEISLRKTVCLCVQYGTVQRAAAEF